MSLSTVALVFMNPPPKLNYLNLKIPFSSPGFCRESSSVSWKSVRPQRVMAAENFESRVVDVDSDDESVGPAVSGFEQEVLIDDGGVSFHQTPDGLHILFNRLSKWVVAVTFGGVLALRHDGLAFWAAMGSVLNAILSTILKQIVKQERPVSEISSGHGMPSSHAQSIFYAVIFVIMSVVGWLGLNAASASLSGLIIAIGSYFSWLRVSLRYHTTSQVAVGAVVGSVFSGLWFWLWDSIVGKAYSNNLWVQIVLVIGAACFCGGFIVHVFQHWIKDEH